MRGRSDGWGHGFPKDGGNSPGSTGVWRGSRTKAEAAGETYTEATAGIITATTETETSGSEKGTETVSL